MIGVVYSIIYIIGTVDILMHVGKKSVAPGIMFLMEAFCLTLVLHMTGETYLTYGTIWIVIMLLQIFIVLYVLNKKIEKEIEEKKLKKLRKETKKTKEKLKKEVEKLKKEEKKIETEKSFIRKEKAKVELWSLQPEKKVLGTYLREIRELKDTVAKKEKLLKQNRKEAKQEIKNYQKDAKKYQKETQEKTKVLNERIQELEKQREQDAWRIKAHKGQLEIYREEVAHLRGKKKKKQKPNKTLQKKPTVKKQKPKRHHSKKKLFICSRCGKEFATSEALSQHKKDKYPEKKRSEKKVKERSGIFTIDVPGGDDLFH